MVEQPGQVEQTLIDDALADRAFLFDDDRASIFVNAECINPSAVRFAGAVLGGKETDSEKLLQIGFNQLL